MKLFVVAIRDRKADVFVAPGFVNNIGICIRDFGESINNEKSFISKYPNDYDLYKIGELDDGTGEIVACRPEQLAIGEQLVRNRG